VTNGTDTDFPKELKDWIQNIWGDNESKVVRSLEEFIPEEWAKKKEEEKKSKASKFKT
jgi:hypothetical protein